MILSYYLLKKAKYIKLNLASRKSFKYLNKKSVRKSNLKDIDNLLSHFVKKKKKRRAELYFKSKLRWFCFNQYILFYTLFNIVSKNTKYNYSWLSVIDKKYRFILSSYKNIYDKVS